MVNFALYQTTIVPAQNADAEFAHDRVAVELAPNRTYTVACYPVGLGDAPPTGVRTLDAT